MKYLLIILIFLKLAFTNAFGEIINDVQVKNNKSIGINSIRDLKKARLLYGN